MFRSFETCLSKDFGSTAIIIHIYNINSVFSISQTRSQRSLQSSVEKVCILKHCAVPVLARFLMISTTCNTDGITEGAFIVAAEQHALQDGEEVTMVEPQR